VAGVLILNVVGNVALIPRYGPVGAAWATAVSQVVLAWQLRRGLDRHGEVADA
jgi:O-antigen/teichoic acid export membrane protein